MRDPTRDFDNLRKWRVPKATDFGIANELTRMCADVRAESQAAADAALSLSTVLPESLREFVCVKEFNKGVLTLKVSHAAHRYTLEQWLRAGGLAAIRGAIPGKVTKVKCL